MNRNLILAAVVTAGIVGCSAMDQTLEDIDLTFSSQEDRIAYWKQECIELGATEENMYACIQNQQALFQQRTH